MCVCTTWQVLQRLDGCDAASKILQAPGARFFQWRMNIPVQMNKDCSLGFNRSGAPPSTVRVPPSTLSRMRMNKPGTEKQRSSRINPHCLIEFKTHLHFSTPTSIYADQLLQPTHQRHRFHFKMRISTQPDHTPKARAPTSQHSLKQRY